MASLSWLVCLECDIGRMPWSVGPVGIVSDYPVYLMGLRLLSGYQGKLAMLPSAAHEALTLLCLLRVFIPIMEVT